MPKFVSRGVMATVGLLLLAACTTVRTKTPEGEAVTMTEAEFAAYVEHVFRHHNRVYNELINDLTMIEDNEGAIPDTELVNAEAKMLNACLSVNEIVSAMSEGRNPGMKSKMQLVHAVPDCEIATRKVEKLIPEEFSDIIKH